MDGKKSPFLIPPVAANSRLLLVLGLAITLSIFALGIVSIVQSRQDEWDLAEKASDNLLTALESDITRNMMQLDLSLQGVIEALETPGIESVPQAVFQHALFDRSASTEDIASLSVFDRNGNRIHSSKPIGSESINLSDTEMFQLHRARADAGLFISRPYRSRTRGGEYSIAMSRRLPAKDGDFAGIVVGALRLRYFARLFERLDVGANGSISLVRTDGHLITRHPFKPEDVDRDLSNAATVSIMLKSLSGHFVAKAALDGVDRFYMFRRLDDLPFILTINRSVDDVMSKWRCKAILDSAVLAALCLSTLGLTLLFYREVRRREAAEDQLNETAARLSIMATTDALTGLGNRRTMEADLDREWRRAIRSVRPIALLMLDVDHFKLFNDRYGHPEGDNVLRQVAHSIRESLLRSSDLVSRYGGEEFIALLPNTDEAGAQTIAERVRASVEALRLPHELSARGYVTISVGVAVARPRVGQSEREFVKAADVALYNAKRAGRNCVTVTTFSPPDRGPSGAGERSAWNRQSEMVVSG